MREKVMTLDKAADLIQDSMLMAVGGNGMHRNPVLFTLALTKRPVKDLKVCGTLGIAADILFSTFQADTAYFGFYGFENEAGLAPGMRKAMEGPEPKAKAVEASCAALFQALRAGAAGIPFIPVAGMWGSDLVQLRPEFFQVMKSPFDGSEVISVKALVPDYAVLHVQEADVYGNCRILGPSYQDSLLARAAKKTIVTAERIVGTYRMQEKPELTSIPHYLVEAVVELPGGAKPGICYPEYQTVDWPKHKAYGKAVKEGSVSQFADIMLEGRL